jgi:hypothetical protein
MSSAGRVSHTESIRGDPVIHWSLSAEACSDDSRFWIRFPDSSHKVHKLVLLSPIEDPMSKPEARASDRFKSHTGGAVFCFLTMDSYKGKLLYYTPTVASIMWHFLQPFKLHVSFFGWSLICANTLW